MLVPAIHECDWTWCQKWSEVWPSKELYSTRLHSFTGLINNSCQANLLLCILKGGQAATSFTECFKAHSLQWNRYLLTETFHPRRDTNKILHSPCCLGNGTSRTLYVYRCAKWRWTAASFCALQHTTTETCEGEERLLRQKNC